MFRETNLHIPPLGGNVFLRKHLLSRLSAGRSSRLIAINGPAGSGKTTLVRHWMSRENLPVAWYSLDEMDNDPDLFYGCLLAAVENLGNGLPFEPERRLQRRKGISGREIAPRIIQCFFDLPNDVYLVLDGYHSIGSQEIHGFVDDLLNHAGPRIHIVIASRRPMPFPLSMLRLENQVVEVTAEDLKLSHGEGERFLAEVFSLKLSAGQMHELTWIMEGWMTGLKFFGLSLKGKENCNGFPAALRSACRQAEDYMMDEVINIQSRAIRRFLHLTALLHEFNADLCGETTGLRGSEEMLKYIHRNNLFLVSLDTQGRWYRYHHLFSKAAQRQTGVALSGNGKQAFQRAARWCAKNGYLDDAFRHAFASKDMRFAADMFEDYVEVLYERGEFPLFRRCLAKLPREEFLRRPLLGLLECRFRMESIQLAEIPLILAEIESRPEAFGRYEGEKKRLCDDLLLLFKCLPDWLDPPNGEADCFDRFLCRVSPKNRSLSGIIAMMRPLSYFLQGRMPLAAEALRGALSRVLASGNLLSAAIWFRTMATVERLQGRLSCGESVLEDASLFFQRNGSAGLQLEFVLYLPRAWVFLLRNNLQKAMEYAIAALKRAEQAGFLYEIVDGSFLLLLIYTMNGEAGKASKSMRRMQKAARATGSPGIMALTNAYLARFSAIHGDLDRAGQWAEQRQFHKDEPFSFQFVPECMAQSQLLYARGRYREAADLLEMLRKRCIDQNMMEAVLEADLLYSPVLYALNDVQMARKIMSEALGFAETEGYVRVFVSRSRIISPILVRMAGTGPKASEPSYLFTIAQACGLHRNPIGADGNRRRGGEPLTVRELEILRLIGVGCRNKEIAEKAFISLDTVRTHTTHIFQKLEVKTRVQAIRRAEELNILPGSGQVDRSIRPKVARSDQPPSHHPSSRHLKNHTKV